MFKFSRKFFDHFNEYNLSVIRKNVEQRNPKENQEIWVEYGHSDAMVKCRIYNSYLIFLGTIGAS